MRPNKPYTARDASLKNYEHQSNRYHQRRQPFLCWFRHSFQPHFSRRHQLYCPSCCFTLHLTSDNFIVESYTHERYRTVKLLLLKVIITEGMMPQYVDFHVGKF